MFRSLCLAAMLMFVGATSVSAAAVPFIGIMTARLPATGGSFGLAPGTTFEADIYIADSVTNSSVITGGVFNFSNGLNIVVTGGTVDILAGNNVQFVINTTQSSPSADILFQFSGVAGLGTGINSAQMNLLTGYSTSFNVLENGSLPFYEGTITAVPEPSSVLALAGLTIGGIGYRWRKRRVAAQA